MTDASHMRVSRRRLLELGAGGIAVGTIGAALIGNGLRSPGAARAGASPTPLPDIITPGRRIALVGTDGFLRLPTSAIGEWGDDIAEDYFLADGSTVNPSGLNVYGYGFRDITGPQEAIRLWQVAMDGGAPNAPPESDTVNYPLWQAAQDGHTAIYQLKGNTQWQSVTMEFNEGDQVGITLYNLGWKYRVDIPDGHTIHWHGFKNATPWFDGVPEMSGAAPINKTFSYFYDVKEPGTYMFHCHWEDVEHIQMGMTGSVFVNPKQNGTLKTYKGRPFTKFAYNDGDGSTGFDRHFTMMLMDYDLEQHRKLSHIQQPDWSDYVPRAWTINGRAYPDTIASHGTLTDDQVTFEVHDLIPAGLAAGTPRDELRYQPLSSLVTCNEGDRVLLRIVSLGYQQHAMTADGITLEVFGRDANKLGDAAYETDTLDVAPGEGYDAFFWAPAHSGGTDPDRYLFYDRNFDNNGAGATTDQASNCGMATEIWVYPAGTRPDQTPDLYTTGLTVDTGVNGL